MVDDDSTATGALAASKFIFAAPPAVPDDAEDRALDSVGDAVASVLNDQWGAEAWIKNTAVPARGRGEPGKPGFQLGMATVRVNTSEATKEQLVSFGDGLTLVLRMGSVGAGMTAVLSPGFNVGGLAAHINMCYGQGIREALKRLDVDSWAFLAYDEASTWLKRDQVAKDSTILSILVPKAELVQVIRAADESLGADVTRALHTNEHGEIYLHDGAVERWAVEHGKAVGGADEVTKRLLQPDALSRQVRVFLFGDEVSMQSAREGVCARHIEIAFGVAYVNHVVSRRIRLPGSEESR